MCSDVVVQHVFHSHSYFSVINFIKNGNIRIEYWLKVSCEGSFNLKLLLCSCFSSNTTFVERFTLPQWLRFLSQVQWLIYQTVFYHQWDSHKTSVSLLKVRPRLQQCKLMAYLLLPTNDLTAVSKWKEGPEAALCYFRFCIPFIPVFHSNSTLKMTKGF